MTTPTKEKSPNSNFGKLLRIFAKEISEGRAQSSNESPSGAASIRVAEYLTLWFDPVGALIRLEFADERKLVRNDLIFTVARAQEKLT